jgi:hypothetical protein
VLAPPRVKDALVIAERCPHVAQFQADIGCHGSERELNRTAALLDGFTLIGCAFAMLQDLADRHDMPVPRVSSMPLTGVADKIRSPTVAETVARPYQHPVFV